MNGFDGKNLVVFGDSIMYGSGNNGFGVGEYLKKDLGFKLYKYCIGGARTGWHEGKSWIVEQVCTAVNDKIPADYIVFNGFTNDCNMTDGVNCDVPLGDMSDSAPQDIFEIGKQNTTFSGCFEAIVCAFKRYFPQAKLLFVRPHRMGRRGEAVQIEYGERAVQICKKHGVAVADLYAESGLDTFLCDHRDKYTCDSYGWGRGDCTHPNALGYEKFYMPIIENKLKSL